MKTNGVEECSCPREFVGPTCSRSVCENFCARGNCTIISGEPVCSCPPGYSGKKCDRDACQVKLILKNFLFSSSSHNDELTINHFSI